MVILCGDINERNGTLCCLVSFEWPYFVLCLNFALCAPMSMIIWDSDKWLASSWGHGCVPRLHQTKVTRLPGACVVLSSPTPCWGEDGWSLGTFCCFVPPSCLFLALLRLVCPKLVSNEWHPLPNLSIILLQKKNLNNFLKMLVFCPFPAVPLCACVYKPC